jgi:hypothetical protein
MRRLPLIALALLALGAVSGVAAYEGERAAGNDAHWQEIAWPYPRDGWPAGRAFRCESCGGQEGGQVELYVRPKIGFCNCDTGVADDDEVDRVADLDLISEKFSPLAPGKVVRVDDMSGRARVYDLAMAGGAHHTAIGFALSHRCDLLVAVTQGEGEAGVLERAALEFLAADEMHRWMMAALGGR